MHEFLLFGQVPSHKYERVLQQLAGVTRMQPLRCKEVHLIFKARPPAPVGTGPPVGGSQDVVQPEIQRTRLLLSGNLFYIQLVGEVVDVSAPNSPGNGHDGSLQSANGDVPMTGTMHDDSASGTKIQWKLEFRDIPDAGKQPVTVRLMSRTLIQKGDILQFLLNFGFEWGFLFSIMIIY